MLGITEHHHSDFTFLTVECEAKEIAGKLDHLVELGFAQAFDLGDAVPDFPHGPDVGLGDPGGDVGDFLFQFLKDIAHGIEW